jgi:hypothetical protein
MQTTARGEVPFHLPAPGAPGQRHRVREPGVLQGEDEPEQRLGCVRVRCAQGVRVVGQVLVELPHRHECPHLGLLKDHASRLARQF